MDRQYLGNITTLYIPGCTVNMVCGGMDRWDGEDENEGMREEGMREEGGRGRGEQEMIQFIVFCLCHVCNISSGLHTTADA